MIAVPSSSAAPLEGGLSPLLRTPPPRSDTAPDFFRGLPGTPPVRHPTARRFRAGCAPPAQVRVQCGRALGPGQSRRLDSSSAHAAVRASGPFDDGRRRARLDAPEGL